MRRVSSGVNGAIPEILTGVNLPESSTMGKLPGERIRSLTLLETPSMASNRAGVGMGLDAGATGVGAFLAAVSILYPFQRRRDIYGLRHPRQAEVVNVLV